MHFTKAFFFLALLSLASCGREDYTGEWENEIIIPPSEEVEVRDLEGKVINRFGTAVSNARVRLFDESGFLSETVSSPNGKFSFDELVLGTPYFIVVNKEAYVTALTDITSFLADGGIDLQVGMLESSEVPGHQNPLDPLDEESVVVSGRLVYEAGEPAEVVLAYSWDNGMNSYFAYAVDGRFALLVPKGAVVEIYAQDFCTPDFSEPVILGPYDSNTDIGVQELADKLTAPIQGEVTDCTGSPATDVLIIVSDYLTGMTVDTVPVVNGTFSLSISSCELVDYQIEVWQNGQPANVSIIPLSEDFLLIGVCDQGSYDVSGSLTLSLAGDSIVFTQMDVMESVSGLLNFTAFDSDRFLFFTIETSAPVFGNNYAMYLEYISFPNFTSRYAGDVILSLNGPLDISGTGIIEIAGTLEGTLYDDFGNSEPVEGMLDLTLQ